MIAAGAPGSACISVRARLRASRHESVVLRSLVVSISFSSINSRSMHRQDRSFLMGRGLPRGDEAPRVTRPFQQFDQIDSTRLNSQQPVDGSDRRRAAWAVRRGPRDESTWRDDSARS